MSNGHSAGQLETDKWGGAGVVVLGHPKAPEINSI